MQQPEIPHSREAEEATIGAILINEGVFPTVKGIIESPADFYIHRLRWLWEAFVKLDEEKKPIDLMTVTDELVKADRVQEIGGPAFITALVASVPTSLNAEHYAQSVRDYAKRRNLLRAAQKITQDAYDLKLEITDIEASATKRIEEAKGQETRSIVSLQTMVANAYDRIEERSKTKQTAGISTGYIDLDAKLNGLQRGKSILVGGRPGMGKSALLTSLSYNLIQSQHNVMIFSPEMPDEEISTRLLAMESRINTQVIESGMLQDDEWTKLTHAVDKMSRKGMNLWVDDTPGITIDQLRQRALTMHHRYGIRVFGVDYVQLLMRGSLDPTTELGNISRTLKLLARETDSTVLALVQLNRDVEKRNDKRPLLSDLKQSGSLEEDADVVIFPFRKEYYGIDLPNSKNRAELIIAKHRGGPTGTVEMAYVAHLTRFESLAKAY